MKGYLIAEEGPLTGLIIRMEEGEEWLLGRDPDLSFQVLEDPMVSRKHLICRLTPKGFIVENLSFTNPASLNGTPITDPAALEEGDILQIGGTLFRFTETDPAGLQPINETKSTDHYPTIIEEENPLDILAFSEGLDQRWMLKVISGPNTGAEFGLEEGVTYILGKDPQTCDVIFQDLSVSRQHAKIHLKSNTEILIEDLKSKNGTFVNGRAIEEPTLLTSQDLVALGTTSFLMIDREQTRETIYSPAPAFISQEEELEKEEKLEKTQERVEKSWKDLLIPTRHLILAGAFGFLLLVGLFSAIALFQSKPVEVAKVDTSHLLKEIFKKFPGVEYSYNESMGKIFLIGDVISEIEKQELMYHIKNLSFIHSMEDGVVVDEIVFSDMNAFIAKNPAWRAVTMSALAPGRFVLRGYVQTLQDASSLMEYLAMNFPYNEKLENQVVVASNLEAQVQSLLTEKGFLNVSFQLSNGEIILGGRVNDASEHAFQELIKELKKLSGIRSVKNFVILTTASTARINISDRYKVTGTSKFGKTNQWVVINGQILTMGDILDGMIITHLESDAIFLEKDGLKYRINYNQQ